MRTNKHRNHWLKRGRNGEEEEEEGEGRESKVGGEGTEDSQWHKKELNPRGKERREEGRTRWCVSVAGCKKGKRADTDSGEGYAGRRRRRQTRTERGTGRNEQGCQRERKPRGQRLPCALLVPQLSPSRCYDCTVCSFGVRHGGAALMKGVY